MYEAYNCVVLPVRFWLRARRSIEAVCSPPSVSPYKWNYFNWRFVVVFFFSTSFCVAQVTSKNPELIGIDAIVVKAPVYPNTWVTLRSVETDKIVKVRTSQLVRDVIIPQASA